MALTEEVGWGLPGGELSDYFPMTRQIIRPLPERLSLDVTVLRWVHAERDAGGEVVWRVYEVENQSPEWLVPVSARWVGIDELAGLPLAEPELRPVLDWWLAEVASGAVPTERVAWAWRGWFAGASRWIDDRLVELGLTRVGPIEQVKSWQLSCLLRVATDGGDLFFKATCEALGAETALTAALAEWFPGWVPEVLAANRRRHWLRRLLTAVR